MPFNGSGTFSRLYNWVTDKANAVKITASRMDDEFDGVATGLSNCLTRDGQSPPSQNIPFNNKRITGLADATADTDALNRQSADARYVPLSGSGSISTATASARLSLASGVAITGGDLVGQGTIYYVAAGHNIAPIYDGTQWVARTMATEPSLVLTAPAHLANREYSVFRYWTGSAVAIGTGPVWANSTTVGTGPGTSQTETFEGRRVNMFDITLTNSGIGVSVPARRAVLIGGFGTTAIAGQTNDARHSRLLSNEDYAVPRAMLRVDGTDTWLAGAGDVWRKAGNSSLNVLEVFHIGGGRPASANDLGIGIADTVGGTMAVGVGIDLDTPPADCLKHYTVQPNAGFRMFMGASWAGYLDAGRRQMRWLERVNTIGSFTWIGDNGNNLTNQSGIRGEVWN